MIQQLDEISGLRFQEGGFEKIQIHRVGRIPTFAKSMILVATAPDK